MPVVGFLYSQGADQYVREQLRAFRQTLKEAGYTEGENVATDFRYAENQPERLPVLAADLVRQKVAVIVAFGGPASNAAAQASKTIPIVFSVPEDPVRLGLVASLARPKGNATGVNFFTAELSSKRVELLRELAPVAKQMALLINPAEPSIAEAILREAMPAARAIGVDARVLQASNAGEINKAFDTLMRERPDALFVGSGPFFNFRHVQIVHLATRLGLPAIYAQRTYTEAGGLMSYGTDVSDRYRQVGRYVGRILNGEKPGDMPVVQSTKFELVINAQTAHMLGIAVPPSMLSRADEVIE